MFSGRSKGRTISQRMCESVPQLLGAAARWPSEGMSVLPRILRQLGHLHEMLEEADLERRVAVDGHRQSHPAARPAVDVVTSLDSQEGPAVTLDHPGQFLAREGLHTTMSRTLSVAHVVGDSTSTERQPSTAS